MHGPWKPIADLEAAERAELEARQHARRMEWFHEEMKIQHGFFDHLGWIGGAFKDALACARYTQDFDVHFSNKDTRAVLTSHNLTKGFVGEISFGKAAADDSNRFSIFWALVHEGTHLANQYHRVAAMHATPFNARAKVVLCPRDAMILNVLIERQAFAMQLVMDDLLDGVVNGFMSSDEIPSPADLQVSLQQYAAVLDPRMKWTNESQFLDFYRGRALDRYEETGRVLHLKENNIQYARLSLDQLKVLNDCFGMTTFGIGDAELESLLKVTFTPEQQARLDQANRDLGIDESKLPMLEAALAGLGTNAEAFLEVGRSPVILPTLPLVGGASAPVPGGPAANDCVIAAPALVCVPA